MACGACGASNGVICGGRSAPLGRPDSGRSATGGEDWATPVQNETWAQAPLTVIVSTGSVKTASSLGKAYALAEKVTVPAAAGSTPLSTSVTETRPSMACSSAPAI